MSVEKFRALRGDLCDRFPEREDVIDGCLAAVLAGEHVLLVGAPGTAKSALARAIAGALGGTYFERLLTKLTQVEELFGPLSLKALENDRFERVITGKLPTVEYAFLDEVFKSSSTILNSLLTIMNERIYHNDGPPITCPLVTLFGASNEIPDGGDLDALYDRFLVRFDVKYLEKQDSLRKILTAEDPVSSVHVTRDELLAAQQGAMATSVSSETVDGLIAVRAACNEQKIAVSDRRWKRSLKIVQSSAYLRGEKETSPDDLVAMLPSMLWREPSEHTKISRLVAEHADPMMMQVKEIRAAAEEVAKVYKKMMESGQVKAGEMAAKKFSEQRAQLDMFLGVASERTKVHIKEGIAALDANIARAKRPAIPAGTTLNPDGTLRATPGAPGRSISIGDSLIDVE